ncbi:hypothetical protein N7509_009237 [Penicillium cosmopolitanum]|uniref:Rhodopsin domain-containing protein n=1 Tax=Penicillium cosmopolitanum TaxID=1131564 RepID=A0A9W9VP40_9EURO|nr:uncharacterized protein N7509_009237 [Penicillium cosmopolitanum]KAJ5386696.1 hypothetical protein N7509_009237 [Penicillium cosmopolitanum]
MATESAAIDAQTQGPTILAACWVLVVIPGLIVALRLWCKLGLSRRGFGWDDLLICLAWALQLVYTALNTKAVQMGVVGKHVFAIENPELIPPALKLVYISYVIIIISCVFSKTSFAFTLMRIVTKTWMKALLWVIIITMNAVMWLCAICYLAQCRPAAALWDASLLATAKCWPTYVFETIALVAGAYSGCMDFILALLPWVVLWNLEMKKREKAGIALAMSMGVFAAVTAFIKTSKLVNVSQVQDFTWFCSTLTIWASAETGCTIFAASIPSLRILFVRISSSYHHSGDTSDTYNGEAITLQAHKEGSSAQSIQSEPGITTTQEVSVEHNGAQVRQLGA